jgi:secreted trypsin-like serine protease
VLTVAHCLVDPDGTHNPPEFQLQAPKINYTVGYGSIRSPTSNQVPISEVKIHPQYKPGEDPYNLALIKLETSLPLDKKWRPARITLDTVKSGDKLITLGWSRKKNDEWSDVLQKLELTAGPDFDCQTNYEDWDGQDGEHVCTSNGRGRGICDSDGGGPLVLPISPDSDDFAGYLVGITNFYVNSDDPEFKNCADGDLITNYFTRVGKYVGWIANVMGVDSSKLIASPETSRPSNDESNPDESSPDDSAASFPMKRFDNALLSIMLCLLTLATIAF